jgi:DNA (cytosine-5)-methyltransferase 1
VGTQSSVRKFKSIDLFAGCGGLSLGLEMAGFETVFVNELHPDAMQTFLINRPYSNLSQTENHVNDIFSLTRNPKDLAAFKARMQQEHGEIDLVCGGPPCQGYSGIGHRRTFKLNKEEIPTNHLYREMAKVVQAIAPKIFLFENVRGLLNSKWTSEGENGEIWKDVRHSFEKIIVKIDGVSYKYNIGWQLVFAKDYGVPQNRPRVIMIGIRGDLPFTPDTDFQHKGLLPAITSGAPDLVDLLSDLSDPKWKPGATMESYKKDASTPIQKYLRTRPDGSLMKKGDLLTDHEYSNHSDAIVEKFRYMIRNKSEIPEEMKTKKFSQKVLPKSWGLKGPTITATSMPDDYVHFQQPRVLTVREWARLQTFPDWYIFTGKRTTGGRRRAGDPEAGQWTRDVPKYTQIGNAVPVELARAIGEHLKKLI